jgi:hypothetical protein
MFFFASTTVCSTARAVRVCSVPLAFWLHRLWNRFHFIWHTVEASVVDKFLWCRVVFLWALYILSPLNHLRLSFLYVLFHELIVTRMGNFRFLSFMSLFEACQTSRFEEEVQDHEFVTECIALLVIRLVWFAAIGISSCALLTGSYLFYILENLTPFCGCADCCPQGCDELQGLCWSSPTSHWKAGW